ncbi:MAG TPA: VacJ family lipoprotein, partial [Steroidobacteraceae bacterium]|nr:VacJ family lipoprotein [Steroidobacteraceae bacterium]
SSLDRGPARLACPNVALVRGLVISLLAVVALGGCATTSAAKGSTASEEEAAEARAAHNPDPIEGFNRGVYKFNDAIDRHALRPAAVAYRDHTPAWLQKGVGNFFTNLFYPTTIVNQFLQGKLKEGSQDIARFVINTTLGWGGIFDVATGARLPVHDEDSGQTLGRWGVPPGPYLMLPLLGPATLRDAPARIADDFTQPFRWYDAGNERYFSLAVYLVDKRAGLLQLDRLVNEAYDPYAFVRDAYLQRRQYAVYDGDVPQEELEDDSDWAEEALREDEAEEEE